MPGAQKERYLFVFVASFLMFAAVLIPLIIYNKGYFLYYGDFNSQQLMFYQHCHDFVRENGFGWDWGTDLGSDLIGSYAFYLIGSPFFWLTVPFPSGAVLYIFPWLLCLKTAVAALTSYAYLRRFVKTPNAAAIGAFLYAFSGAQLYNVFFNHFHDVTAFFPLVLLALEMRVQDNRRGVFALAVGLLAIINYYFFASIVVFTIIYYFMRCSDKKFAITGKKFILLAAESVIGVMLAAVIFLPASLAVMGNPRLSYSYSGINMVVYSDKTYLYRIIQSLFMLPDPPARANLFTSDNARWASIAAYLPMFSLAGVIAFVKQKKEHWTKKLSFVCLVFALVPILNSAFQLFNSTFYTRWYFMPVLIIALMTALSVDDSEVDIKKGIGVVTAALVCFSIIFLLPSEKNGVTSYGKVAKYPDLGVLQLSGTLLLFAALVFITYFVFNKKKALKPLLIMTMVSSFVCSAIIIWYGVAQGPINDYYIEHAIEGEINLDPVEDQFFRIDTSENVDNWTMFWGYSSMRCFQSTVSPSIMSFYQDTMGVERNVATRAETQLWGLRNILSVRYYLYEKNNKTEPPASTVMGFEYIGENGEQNDFYIYENKNYIPMGFVYDKYIDIEVAKKLSDTQKSNLAMEAIFLDKETMEKYADIMQDYGTRYHSPSRTDLEELCKKKAQSACYYFKESSDGFEAKINLEKESLVFFSVPYDEGFTAYVNGAQTDIDEVFGGLMAIRVPQGDNEIRFEYETKGFGTGILLTLSGIVIFAAYMILGRVLDKKHGIKYEKNCIYDYTALSDLTDEQAEELYALTDDEDDEASGNSDDDEYGEDDTNTEADEETDGQDTEEQDNGD